MGANELQVSLSGSSSERDIPSPPAKQVSVPLHEDAGPQSPLSSSTTSDQMNGGKMREELGHPRVVVRIRPLTGKEVADGKKPCIKPILTQANPRVNCSSTLGKSKRILSPANAELPPSFKTGTSPQVVTASKPSRTSPSSRNRKKKNFNFEPEDPSKETIATSLISGTENKMRFDFDQVIGPGMSQEQCYERTVGDIVRRNSLRGEDTTIVAVGHHKSGKSHTMSGDWKVRKSSGVRAHVGSSLTDSAGILPRAVYDLFHACTNLSEPCISMAFYMVACAGGRTRDLLSRFRNKSKEVVRGISYVKVDSPLEVKRLMDRASVKRASDVKKGKSFHLFCSFRVLSTPLAPVKTGRSHTEHPISSHLTFVKLTSPSMPNTVFPTKMNGSEYNLRDMVQAMLRPTLPTDVRSVEGNSNFNRRLDEVLLGVVSTIIVGCVSPVESESEYSSDLLRFAAMATKATYAKVDATNEDESNQEGNSNTATVSKSSNLPPEELPSSHFSASDSALSLSLQQTLQQADKAARDAKQSSDSLEDAATRWRSHRRKLNRASTLAALAQLTKLTRSSKGTKPTCASETTVRRQRTHRPRRDCAPKMARAIERNARHDNGQQSRLTQENEQLKSQVGLLIQESKVKKRKIVSLHQKLANVKKKIAQEQDISSKLEDIRHIIRRKALLQEERIQSLEQRLVTEIESKRTLENEMEGTRVVVNNCQCGYQQVKRDIEDQEISQESREEDPMEKLGVIARNLEGQTFTAPDKATNMEHTANTISKFGDMEGDIAPVLNDSGSGTEASIYLPGDEGASEDSKANIQNFKMTASETWSGKKSFVPIDGSERGSPENRTSVESFAVEPISNMNVPEKLTSCPCQNSFLNVVHGDKIEFYLPKLSVSCLCGKQQNMLPQLNDLKSIGSILRPWQAEFLESIGVMEIEKFIELHKNREKELAKRMVEWRAKRGLETMTRKSCEIALLVWSRTFSIAMKATAEGPKANNRQLDLLEISSMDSGRVSSIGFNSSSVCSESRSLD